MKLCWSLVYFYEKTLDIVDITNDPDCPRAGRHCELEKAEVKKWEETVQRVLASVRNSGEPGSFSDPIKKTKLKTTENCNKKITLTSSIGKVMQYQEQSIVGFLLLVKSQSQNDHVDLQELMKYCLVLAPPALEYILEKPAPVSSKGRGRWPPKKLEKHPRFYKAFRQLSEEWNLKYHVLKQLEEFTGQNRESSIDGLRAKLPRKIVIEDDKLTSKSKIDLVRLPPCHSALKPHLQRLNHHVALYKRADESILYKFKPYDDGQGWIRTDDGVVEPVWSCGAALPN
ncbi:hypothetical protein NP493_778g04022 [Ridgeia piscesae]|uniref:Uncharacterized protein n=1 Tax=Ridgeia piscesae TaxID=27915 RepID=A0AAD9KP73_RIDPI|nr:hypothetical protein NP493_778g04022 [Ridgeia piscesae]